VTPVFAFRSKNEGFKKRKIRSAGRINEKRRISVPKWHPGRLPFCFN
jgi:hypothetical protein